MFCVAGMALRDLREIVTCLQTCQKSLCVQGQYFCVVFRRRVAFFVAGAALETSIVILRGRRSTLDVSRCVFFANAIVSAVSSGDNVQTPWPAWHVVTCDDTPRSTLHTLHFTLYTPHSTLYTLHFTLHTLHSTLYTPHSTLYTPPSTLHTLHLTLCCRIALVLGCLHLEKRRDIAKKWNWKMQIWKRHTWQLQKKWESKCKLKRGKNCK